MPPNLTTINPEFDRLVKATPPGMAHWAGTGPTNTTCEQCKHYGYSAPIRNGLGDTISTVKKDKCCRKFFDLMRCHGKPLLPSTPSCRHYQPRD
jgi:hypothetical protein